MGHYGLGITAYDSIEMCKIAFGDDVVAGATCDGRHHQCLQPEAAR